MKVIKVPAWLAARPEYQQAFALGFRQGWGHRPWKEADIWECRFGFCGAGKKFGLQAFNNGNAGMQPTINTTTPLDSTPVLPRSLGVRERREGLVNIMKVIS